MARLRSILLVCSFEVFVTLVVGLGVYVGFSIYPYTLNTTIYVGNGIMDSQFTAAIPVGMPELDNLNIPYTYLDIGAPKWGFATIIVTVMLFVLKSFVRGMYLGSLSGQVRSDKGAPLLAYGRRYLGRMLGWSLFELLYGVLGLLFGAVFFPLVFVLFFLYLIFALTPYLIVLEDLSLGEALGKSPGLLGRTFKQLFPLAVFALIGTSVISMLKGLPAPFGYAIPLLAYAVVGTILIFEVMKQLSEAEGRPFSDDRVPHLADSKNMKQRIRSSAVILMTLVLTVVGAFTASGGHLGIFSSSGGKQLTGIAYGATFSDVLYRSGKTYNSYVWEMDDRFRIELELPDLSGGSKPEELRGIATINWDIDKNLQYGSGTYRGRFITEHKLHYRLVRETAKNGDIYYSSWHGAASILPGGEMLRKPLSVEMIVSGDGSNVFVMRYPTEYDGSQNYRVSDDGRFLTMRTSMVNPDDFRTYWFRESHDVEPVLDLLAAKNRSDYISYNYSLETLLAAALQEADGKMVLEALELMKELNVLLDVPDWDEDTWTKVLRGLYEEARLDEALEVLTHAGIQDGYQAYVYDDGTDEDRIMYRMNVSFPKDTLTIEYEVSREEHQLQSLKVLGWQDWIVRGHS